MIYSTCNMQWSWNVG